MPPVSMLWGKNWPLFLFLCFLFVCGFFFPLFPPLDARTLPFIHFFFSPGTQISALHELSP